MRVAIRRISIGSLAKFGCVLGTVLAFLPSLLCGLIGLVAARLTYRWLESWQELTVSVLGQEIARMDLVQFLRLGGLLKLLQVLTTASAPVLFLTVLLLALVSGIVLAAMIALAGLVYNLVASATGGLVVETSSFDDGPVPHGRHDVRRPEAAP